MLFRSNSVSLGCKSSISKSDQCSSLTGAAADLCYQTYGILSSSSEICKMITPDGPYSTMCFSTVAANLKDPTICDHSGLAINNLWACYSNYSLSSGDIAGCSQIHTLASNSRFDCAFEFAKKFGDPSACDIIEQTGSRIVCYQGVLIYSPENLNVSTCHSVLNYNWMNKCYLESAKKYSNVSICDQIDDDSYRLTCIDAYNANKTNSSK